MSYLEILVLTAIEDLPNGRYLMFQTGGSRIHGTSVDFNALCNACLGIVSNTFAQDKLCLPNSSTFELHTQHIYEVVEKLNQALMK